MSYRVRVAIAICWDQKFNRFVLFREGSSIFRVVSADVIKQRSHMHFGIMSEALGVIGCYVQKSEADFF